MTMDMHHYTLRFLTPAFLGDADQKGAWRTPPIKHLLREWWRVAWAAEHRPGEWPAMRHEEGRLFGHAWLEDDRDADGKPVHARRSRVLVRLSSWRRGRLRDIPRLPKVAEGKATSAELYLGYGPVEKAGGLCHPPAIGEGEQAELRLAWPKGHGSRLEATLALIQAFGTLGGRSRNGWGSLRLFRDRELIPFPLLEPYLADWKQALEQAWPHAIGRDEKGPLLWRTEDHDSWEGVMGELGWLRKLVNGEVGRDRPLLNQPVPKKASDRVPSSLRFKVLADEQGYFGLIYHQPHTPPPLDGNSLDRLIRVWTRVHHVLDGEAQRLQRL